MLLAEQGNVVQLGHLVLLAPILEASAVDHPFACSSDDLSSCQLA
jgi:hypothetical protein